MGTMFTFECTACDHEFIEFADRDGIMELRLDCPECNAKEKGRRIFTSSQLIDDTFKEPLVLSTLKPCTDAAVAAGAPYDVCNSRSEVRNCLDMHAKRYGIEVYSPDGV